MKVLDAFAGSGCVSRLLKTYASELTSNDLEEYAQVINSCYLQNEMPDTIVKTISYLNDRWYSFKHPLHLIAENYAPDDDNKILPGERVFYTTRNAAFIDKVRQEISTFPLDVQKFLLGPLLVQASINCNTSGVFKGFHKKDGVGHFGGKGENALSRIKKNIILQVPLLMQTDCQIHVTREDAGLAVKNDSYDMIYLDPPYNQHPYGSNYFMLNYINQYDPEVKIQSGVSGITEDWNRSDYNNKKAATALEELVRDANASFLLFSYNNEGIIPITDLRAILEKYGTVEMIEQKYNAYRGSRNLDSRKMHVQELLWVLKKR
jgi:adenine-specific DNA-methyltransferase